MCGKKWLWKEVYNIYLYCIQRSLNNVKENGKRNKNARVHTTKKRGRKKFNEKCFFFSKFPFHYGVKKSRRNDAMYTRKKSISFEFA